MARRGNLTLNRLHSLLDALHEDLAAFAIKDLTVDLCADAAMPAVTSATQRRSSVCRRCEGGARGFVCNRVHQHTKTQGRRQRAIRRTGLAWRPWSLRLAWIHPRILNRNRSIFKEHDPSRSRLDSPAQKFAASPGSCHPGAEAGRQDGACPIAGRDRGQHLVRPRGSR
jgi:hypothetical protein